MKRIHWVLALSLGLFVPSTLVLAPPALAVICLDCGDGGGGGGGGGGPVVDPPPPGGDPVPNPTFTVAVPPRATVEYPSDCKAGEVYRAKPKGNHSRQLASGGQCVPASCAKQVGSSGDVECKPVDSVYLPPGGGVLSR